MSSHQVLIIKEAQSLKKLDELNIYLEKPLLSNKYWYSAISIIPLIKGQNFIKHSRVMAFILNHQEYVIILFRHGLKGT